MITDLFSHKIHSSTEEWPYKLIDIASVFAEFDGMPYDRSAIEKRFQEISPRASAVARDPSKYRDEISAYPAYLGLYRLEPENGQLIFKLSETAKRFLIVEEPNVSAFMILQLLLFQYPNGMGARSSNNGSVTIQANARDRTLQFIEDGIHISPFRLICAALLADSQLNGIDSHHPRVTINEIFILANDPRTNKAISPLLADVVTVLSEARDKILSPPPRVERRFHILNHTDFIEVTNGVIHLREAISPEDRDSLITKLQTINSIDTYFNEFDTALDETMLSNIIASGRWGRYFDGIVQLTAEVVQSLTNENPASVSIPVSQEPIEGDEIISDNSAIRFNYPLRERDGSLTVATSSRKAQIADPEVTRIKRQRSNLEHKILTHKMDEHLRSLGAVPYENEHIDLFAKIPDDGTFIFEVKSITSENLLSQTRKGLSQLYEYRYRYSSDIGDDITLCLVYPVEPKEIDWLQDYLCRDREIAVCWFNGDTLCYPPSCAQKLHTLLPQSH